MAAAAPRDSFHADSCRDGCRPHAIRTFLRHTRGVSTRHNHVRAPCIQVTLQETVLRLQVGVLADEGEGLQLRQLGCVSADHAGQGNTAELVQLRCKPRSSVMVCNGNPVMTLRSGCGMSRTSGERGRRDVVLVPEPVPGAQDGELLGEQAAEGGSEYCALGGGLQGGPDEQVHVAHVPVKRGISEMTYQLGDVIIIIITVAVQSPDALVHGLELLEVLLGEQPALAGEEGEVGLLVRGERRALRAEVEPAWVGG